MLAPAKHRFSVRDYYRMAETRVLAHDARVELLNGEIIDMSPIGPFHGGVVNYLTKIFTTGCRDRWITAVQNPVRLDEYSEPQPDLMLLSPAADYYRSRHPSPREVQLLIEVSDSSLSADRENKLPAYGRAGIPEVWIVNLIDLAVEVYREPRFSGYASKTVLRAGDHATVLAFPDTSVGIAELLSR